MAAQTNTIDGNTDATATEEAPPKDASSDENNAADLWPGAWGEVAQNFKKNCEDGDYLDVYQLCGWMAYNEESRVKRWFQYLKACCCALFQTAGLLVFIYNALREGTKGVCDGDGDWDVKVIAVVSTLYISLTMGGLINRLDSQGLYEWDSWSNEEVPAFVSPFWLFFGLYCNYFALIGAIYGSFLVIYLSESVLDVVLNAVALFFVVELDDLMIDKYDYERIIEWFQEEYERNLSKYRGSQHTQNKCESACTCCMGTIVVVFVILAMLGAAAAPIYMAICF
mmetsp:Transcript_42433/g.68197  ORF Transcript_42433/g.68197 Transcript_42433/m.68197 type:complete len:282 (+) Transcript_42433:42-887(+)